MDFCHLRYNSYFGRSKFPSFKESTICTRKMAYIPTMTHDTLARKTLPRTPFPSSCAPNARRWPSPHHIHRIPPYQFLGVGGGGRSFSPFRVMIALRPISTTHAVVIRAAAVINWMTIVRTNTFVAAGFWTISRLLQR